MTASFLLPSHLEQDQYYQQPNPCEHALLASSFWSEWLQNCWRLVGILNQKCKFFSSRAAHRLAQALFHCGITNTLWYCCYIVALLLHCGIVATLWHNFFKFSKEFLLPGSKAGEQLASESFQQILFSIHFAFWRNICLCECK